MQSPVIRGTLALAVLAFSLTMAGCASMGNNAPQSKQIDQGSLEAGEAITIITPTGGGWGAAEE